MTSAGVFEIESEWVHVAYTATSALREVYGYAGRQGVVNLEGVRFRPRGRASGTLLIYMHPASTLELLPVPRAMAAAGVDVLCAGSRYARNDTPLIMEMVALDLGAYVRHAREVWGYHKVVLAGWSGGGSLSVFYQSQAESPSVTRTPAGDPVDLSGLPPADAVIYHAAHLSRAVVLSEFIDPSVVDEANPDVRDSELDLYDPRNPNQPPYRPEFISRFRAAQLLLHAARLAVAVVPRRHQRPGRPEHQRRARALARHREHRRRRRAPVARVQRVRGLPRRGQGLPGHQGGQSLLRGPAAAPGRRGPAEPGVAPQQRPGHPGISILDLSRVPVATAAPIQPSPDPPGR